MAANHCNMGMLKKVYAPKAKTVKQQNTNTPNLFKSLQSKPKKGDRRINDMKKK